MLNKSEVLRKLIDEYDVKATKGVQKIRDWNQILAHLSIYSEDRISSLMM